MMKLNNFSLYKSLVLCKKARFCSIFFKICFLWSRYGDGTGTITFKSRNRNHNFLKVGTEIITFQKSDPNRKK